VVKYLEKIILVRLILRSVDGDWLGLLRFRRFRTSLRRTFFAGFEDVRVEPIPLCSGTVGSDCCEEVMMSLTTKKLRKLVDREFHR
jgi:hypothetical protein